MSNRCSPVDPKLVAVPLSHTVLRRISLVAHSMLGSPCIFATGANRHLSKGVPPLGKTLSRESRKTASMPVRTLWAAQVALQAQAEEKKRLINEWKQRKGTSEKYSKPAT